jgi:hypothetical protein
MLPKLRVTLTAALAACVMGLAAGAGWIGARDAEKQLADVPSVSQPLMQQAIVEDLEGQHLQLLAYTRRADELLRLRELSATPARAVVEYAERALAETADPTAAPAAPETAAAPPAETAAAGAPTAAPPASETAATEPSAAVASAPPPFEPLPAPTPTAPSPPASETANQPAPSNVASAPAASASAPSPDETAAPPTTAEPAPAPAATSGDPQIANAQSGSGETAAVAAPERLDDQSDGDAKAAQKNAAQARKPKKKARVVARAVPARLPPAASTGFPVDLPQPSYTRTSSATSAPNHPINIFGRTPVDMGH